VQKFIKLSAAVHELSKENLVMMLKTILLSFLWTVIVHNGRGVRRMICLCW